MITYYNWSKILKYGSKWTEYLINTISEDHREEENLEDQKRDGERTTSFFG